MGKLRMIQIPAREYKRLKKLEQVDFDLLRSFERGLEDLKEGRVRRVK